MINFLRPLTIWCLVAASLVGVVAWADLVLVLKGGSAGLAENSLRPALFGVIPAEATAAGFAPNDLSTSVRTDVAETSRGADIAIPSGAQSSPYTASTANRRYYLTADTTFETAGVVVAAANVTIDLNGYTLTYMDVGPVGVETGTVGSASDPDYPTISNPTGITLTSDSHVYHVIEFTSGNENGNFYEVRANTTTTMTLENHTDAGEDAVSWENGGPANGDTFRIYDPRDTFGVGTAPGVYIDGVEIVNGVITQSVNGYGRGSNYAYCNGVAPISRYNGNGAWMVGGVEVNYHSVNTGGIRIANGAGCSVTYCEVNDLGWVVTNRQRNCPAVDVGGSGGAARYNLITGHRHLGIDCDDSTTVEYNEMYGDSRATNAAGVNMYGDDSCTVRYNNIYKVGEHPVGIAVHSDGAQGNTVAYNWCESQVTRGSAEYGYNNAVGLSNRWGARTTENYIHNNCFITYSDEFDAGSVDQDLGRTLFCGDLDEVESERIEANFIGAYSRDDESQCYCSGVTAASNAVVIRDNTFVGSHNIFWLADDYGASTGYPRYIDNSVAKSGSDPAFKTFIVTDYLTTAMDFISNDFSAGTGLADGDFTGTWDAGTVVRFGWNVTVTVTNGGSPVEGATITVKDKDTNTLRSGYITDANGQVVVDCPTYYRSTNGTTTTTLSPLTVEAVDGLASGSNTISPTSDDTITVTISE